MATRGRARKISVKRGKASKGSGDDADHIVSPSTDSQAGTLNPADSSIIISSLGDPETELPPSLTFLSPVKNNVPLHNNQPLEWNHRVNLIGVKCPNPRIHICEKCKNPILLYGRLIPCKHIFCYECGRSCGTQCPRCGDKVLRVEKNKIGSVFVCSYKNCQRTYLSQRDLQAHIQHRHIRRGQSNFSVASSLTQQI